MSSFHYNVGEFSTPDRYSSCEWYVLDRFAPISCRSVHFYNTGPVFDKSKLVDALEQMTRCAVKLPFACSLYDFWR